MYIDLSGIMSTFDINGGNKNSEGFGFGAGGGWIVFLIIAMMFGWGKNGMGANGGNCATTEDLANGFAQNNISRGIDGIGKGLCDLGYQNAQLASGVKEAITNSAFISQTGFASLGSKLDSCCCETNRSIDGVKYQMATDTCAIITNQNQNANNIEKAIEKISCDIRTSNLEQEIARLNRENHDRELRELELKNQLSQNAQTATILEAVSALMSKKTA